MHAWNRCTTHSQAFRKHSIRVVSSLYCEGEASGAALIVERLETQTHLARPLIQDNVGCITWGDDEDVNKEFGECV